MYNGIGLSTVRGTATSGYVQANRGYVHPSRRRRVVESSLSENRGPKRGVIVTAAAQERGNREIQQHHRKRIIENELLLLREKLEAQTDLTEKEVEERIAAKRAENLDALEEELKRASSMVHDNGTSNAGGREPPQAWQQTQKQELLCFRCGRPGHFARECQIARSMDNEKAIRQKNNSTSTNTHVQALHKERQNSALAQALGIKREHHVEGQAFDQEAQRKRKQQHLEGEKKRLAAEAKLERKRERDKIRAEREERRKERRKRKKINDSSRRKSRRRNYESDSDVTESSRSTDSFDSRSYSSYDSRSSSFSRSSYSSYSSGDSTSLNHPKQRRRVDSISRRIDQSPVSQENPRDRRRPHHPLSRSLSRSPDRPRRRFGSESSRSNSPGLVQRKSINDNKRIHKTHEGGNGEHHGAEPDTDKEVDRNRKPPSSRKVWMANYDRKGTSYDRRHRRESPSPSQESRGGRDDASSDRSMSPDKKNEFKTDDRGDGISEKRRNRVARRSASPVRSRSPESPIRRHRRSRSRSRSRRYSSESEESRSPADNRPGRNRRSGSFDKYGEDGTNIRETELDRRSRDFKMNQRHKRRRSFSESDDEYAER